MKRLFLFIVLISINSILWAQVEIKKIDAEKVYDNGTKTTYVVLNEVISQEIMPVIERVVIADENIVLFSFYDGNDFSKCMYTCSVAIENDYVIDLINDVISECLKEEKH